VEVQSVRRLCVIQNSIHFTVNRAMPPRQELTGATRKSGYDRRGETFGQASPSTLGYH
jgi:hypothetical protein